jgi:hypothetical protein
VSGTEWNEKISLLFLFQKFELLSMPECNWFFFFSKNADAKDKEQRDVAASHMTEAY